MEIHFEDLFQPCPKCGGTGQYVEPLPPGAPPRDHQSQLGVCPQCQGRRGELTPSGVAVARFVRALGTREIELAE